MIYFFDLDGTLVKHGTNEPLPGATDLLAAIARKGGKVIIVTARGSMKHAGHEIYSLAGALKAMRNLGLDTLGTMLIGDADSPRMIVNDEGVGALHRTTNAPWSESDIRDAMTLG